MSEEPTKLFHSFVPHKHRLMMLIGFLRTHLNDTIVVVCAGSNIAEFNSILTNNLDLRTNTVELNAVGGKQNSTTIQGTQKQSERNAAVERFNTGKVKVLFGSAFALSTCDLKIRPTWVLHYDIPKPAEEELRLIRHLNPHKFLILLDPEYRAYLEMLEAVKLESKELAFDEKKLPRLRDQVISLSQKKSYPLYMSSQKGYRELISAYVNHDNASLFNAMKLPLVDVSINFGIEAPPKLPLKK